MQTAADPHQLLEQAWALADAESFKEAHALFVRLCEELPDDPEVWMMRGATQIALGNPRNADTYLEHAIGLDPEYADPYLHLGKLALAMGNTAKALEYGEKALVLDPDYIEAWVLLAASRGAEANYVKAEQCARKGLNLDPRNIQATINLALSLRAQDRFQEAIQHFQRALDQQPESVDVMFDLADCYIRLADYAQAECLVHNIIDRQSSHLNAWHLLGNLQAINRRHKEAIKSYQRLLELQPENAKAHNELGNAYLALDDHVKAENCYRKALQLSDNIPEAYANLGLIIQAKGGFLEAERLCRKALELKPDSAQFHQMLATVLEFLGQYDEAIAHCDLSESCDPNYIPARVAKGRILMKLGKHQQSYSLLLPLIDSGKPEPHTRIVFADTCIKLGQHDQAIAMLEALLDEDNLITRERQQTHAALGRIYDELKNHDQAFRHFQKSNALKVGNFNPQKHENYINRIISTFNPDFLKASQCSHNLSDLPVFIVGMPRSGTSLTEQILSCHPNIYGAGELGDIQIAMKTIASKYAPVTYPECVKLVHSEEFDKLAAGYIRHLRELNGSAQIIIDKMPHNFLHLGLIQLLFPRAKVIHVSRNPMDTCVSCFTQDFTSAHSYAYDLGHLGTYYRQYERLMRHWNKVLTLPIMNIRYEDLVEDQEAISRQLIEFCGLKWDDRVLRFYESGRDIATASFDQVRLPMYKKSVERWRNYETHLGPLISALHEGQE